MHVYRYDGTFEGLLTVIFEIYERREAPDNIVGQAAVQPNLFSPEINVIADAVKANRVWQGLGKRISAVARKHLFEAFLSEQPKVPLLIYQYARLAFASTVSIEDNFAADCVRELAQLHKQVLRESHRMEAFIRFQKTADDLYYATIAPDFEVIPLIATHFLERYADQRWLIYDTKRHYGLYYNLQTVALVNLAEVTDRSGRLPADTLATEEPLYQQLWQAYFHHVNIPERNNRQLHLRQMPLRYWKYLTEKQPPAQQLVATAR